MPNPQLIDYITKARASGVTDADIQKNLLGAGWPQQEIADVFAAASATQRSGTGAAQIAVAAEKKPFPKALIALAATVALLGAGGYFAIAKYDALERAKGAWEKVLALAPFGGGATPQPSPSAPAGTATPTPAPSISVPPLTPGEAGLAKFSSEEEFKEYLANASEIGGFGGAFLQGIAMDGVMERGMPAPAPQTLGAPVAKEGGGGGIAPERISQTNVQVTGIDEPDIVKTDGREIYFSQKYGYKQPLPVPMPGPATRPLIEEESGILPPEPVSTPAPPATKLLKAFPPAEIATDAAIAKTGNLLLSKTMLIILPNAHGYYGPYYYGGDAARNTITAYDVSDPKNPKEAWVMKLDERTMLTAARLTGEKLYLIAQTGIAYDKPCPVVPFASGGVSLSIPCMDIYHPIGNVPVDVTYTALAVNPQNGAVDTRITIAASQGNATFMASPTALYLAYPLPVSAARVLYGFFAETASDLVPTTLLEKLRKLHEYDLSDTAKLAELAFVMERWQGSLSNDERLRVENELKNRSTAYFKAHARDVSRTAIIKIRLTDFALAAKGDVPGTLLNQFSLDEYKGYLRAATTISGQGMWWFGWGSNTESVNDVTVLDGDLRIVGSVQDLGLTERIYSARFVEDKGYLVTFRKIDPFYVLDLSDPARPAMKGELKIPGFSSYLHPITKDLILGVGQEGSQVKLSLFDVANPANPVERDKYNLAEYWTEVSNTHHAFLLDDKHRVFFLPGSRGGYVFSYEGAKLKLVATVADIRAERALYLNDYLYIIGNNNLVVFNEVDWQRVNTLEF